MISKEKIKYFNSLKIKKNRLSQKKIILEGERLFVQGLVQEKRIVQLTEHLKES